MQPYQPYQPVFQDQVSLAVANGSFIVLAKNYHDAKEKINRWLKKLDQRDKQYFTGCNYPQLYSIEIYSTTEEGVLVF